LEFNFFGKKVLGFGFLPFEKKKFFFVGGVSRPKIPLPPRISKIPKKQNKNKVPPENEG